MRHSAAIAIDIKEQADIVRARQAGRELVRSEGLGPADQTRFATVISELTRNALIYAGAGTCEVYLERKGASTDYVVVVSDVGPGIPDINLALSPGYSSGNGLGAGLPGVKRLMDHLSIESRPGATRIVASMSRRRL